MNRAPIAKENDACAIIAFVDKRGHSSHANIVKTIEALKKMAHRSGDINDEGDGCGIMTDIPREVWAARLEKAGLSRHLAESRGFFVGHFLLPHAIRSDADTIMSGIRATFAAKGIELLHEVVGATRDEELGPMAHAEAPLFWQVAGMISEADLARGPELLFGIQMELEVVFPDMHIASLSGDSVVYKVRGVPDLLARVYPELQNPDTRSVMTLGHSRYSTNTLPTVERSQPFSLLGHNGEINTIERLRSTGRTLGIEPVPGGSDSQDLNRILEGLINLYGFDPMEAFAMVFPAVHSEVARYHKDLQDVYSFYRWFFPPSAQGPAAVIARHGHVVMGSVDALGLRPLWFGESDYDFFLSSEKGVVDIEFNATDPKPLAPGEKIAIISGQGRRGVVLDCSTFQRRLVTLMKSRKKALGSIHSLYQEIPPQKDAVPALADFLGQSAASGLSEDELVRQNALAALGWQKYDVDMRHKVATTGRAVIGSMGHMGPLACLNEQALPGISEFFKENVAVVTNPAIDREREADHFSTRVILGDRPDAWGEKSPSAVGLILKSPILLGGCLGNAVPHANMAEIAASFGTQTLEEVLSFFTAQRRDTARVRVLDATFAPADESLAARMAILCDEACEAVRNGAVLLLVDDSATFTDSRVFIDPGLAVASLGAALNAAGLRRECSIIVRSAAIRNLHDLMFLMGLGADALNPYLIWRMAREHATESRPAEEVIRVTMDVLQKGMEKVMSTMGIHEICGYGRIFASIGLADDLAAAFGCPNFCASQEQGLSFARLQRMAIRRLERFAENEDAQLWRDPQRNAKVGRVLRAAAEGRTGYREMARSLEEIEAEAPVALRHLLSFRKVEKGASLAMSDVDITCGNHSMPLVIPAMSFGSQGENSFRTYAETARELNIVCMNGEGGEIPDMLGRYRHNRGQQIASGRFGVHMDFLNSADFLEIKVGQGAKPGEGGHLPGQKVTEMVAGARHCKPGIALISPSNHHDIYSIEDLAQIIAELKTANPEARISVKIPVTSGVGTIAVGVAKAGADIVNISGFDGGTGAAREHAKKYVGLPAEIGVSLAHRALIESGLRDGVELWCDGGMRSGADVLKMIMLGANRVGLGTVSLMGLGCISCQRCHLDLCPRGISTQLRTKEQAAERGVKGFHPVQVAEETGNLVRLLGYIGEEMRSILARLGVRRLADVVGRTDLLEQIRMREDISLRELLDAQLADTPAPIAASVRTTRKPLDYLTRLISDMAMTSFRKNETRNVRYTDEGVRSVDRAVGTFLAGAMSREFGPASDRKAFLRLDASVPGNGLCAFNVPGIECIVGGGAQDGTAKGCFGGTLGVFKGANWQGKRIDGSTGKSFAYGAIGGTLMIQNYADSRACVRMSGADAIFGARITEPVNDDLGNLATRAHLKGFAFEYMTGGRAVVLGDPGPWMCAGMTGGVIYQCLYPEYGFTRASLNRRLATGADVEIHPVDEEGLADVKCLLTRYVEELRRSFQNDEAEAVLGLLREAGDRFVAIAPAHKHPPKAE
ncbi:glutamate synthase (NADPH/NADH) large chain [Desulfobaculum xiamenense]|uniref:Glutamate synthase (NADPH/NADH) large chain n=1 Tax=Desulfobaculum xiamenense TaxID=995050 RepID=A0A846QEU7_9BACT|nr:glutamate synthase-related protein [Desulfobaculum xiamenense]NJB66878.1 glutamate synthase (NADPH/NADH) large chain [Desulfobaculum xiamenense]